MPALAGALALSVALHLPLFWPNALPRMKPVADGVRLTARLRPPAAPAGPAPRAEIVARDNGPAGAPPGRRRGAGGNAATPADERPLPADVLPDDAGLRALRYALLRKVDIVQPLHWPAFAMTMEVRIVARRVRQIRVLRGSGDAAIDEGVRTALAEAAAQLHLPDSVPVTPFALSIELENDGVR